MSEFTDCLFSMILDIQQDRPNLIDPDIDVTNNNGLSSSKRRGATKRSQYDKVPEDFINWTNRWNIGGEYLVHGPMRVVYSEKNWKTFLCFCCHFDAYCESLRNPIEI